MLRSMTAFARHEQTSAWGAITWELRSVNHRYLEASIRLPEMLRSLETPARERIEEAMQQVRGIQIHMPSVMHACLLQFLRDSANPDEREIADSEVHVEMNFLHKHYLSRKDIEACLACDLSEFDASPFRGEVQALMQVLQTKAEE